MSPAVFGQGQFPGNSVCLGLPRRGAIPWTLLLEVPLFFLGYSLALGSGGKVDSLSCSRLWLLFSLAEQWLSKQNSPELLSTPDNQQPLRRISLSSFRKIYKRM
uniref:Uncharacterized protein n=1 Tax=Chrysemys picta bellii TaxID=8478 RepID=A0A8C3I153_CHRPI